MNQLGGLRLAVRVDRASCIEGWQFGYRTLPTARRSRHRFAALAILFGGFAVVGVVRSSSAGKPLRDVIASGALTLGFAAVYALCASSRFRAWASARKILRDRPGPHIVVRHFDSTGYGDAGGGRSSHVDWSAVTVVVEGDRFMALGLGRTDSVSVPIEQLSDPERATIRRWAEAAPGGPRWELRRSARRFPRLQISPDPGPGAADQAPIATTDSFVEVTPVSGESRA
ncbi:MAG TPA: hypothetical protein VFY82_10270 [Acidimicrobiales bacterium]|nr:hypothetical protein [Acidimicrobiales bacterium]